MVRGSWKGFKGGRSGGVLKEEYGGYVVEVPDLPSAVCGHQVALVLPSSVLFCSDPGHGGGRSGCLDTYVHREIDVRSAEFMCS